VAYESGQKRQEFWFLDSIMQVKQRSLRRYLKRTSKIFSQHMDLMLKILHTRILN